jgi:hypothetical protein
MNNPNQQKPNQQQQNNPRPGEQQGGGGQKPGQQQQGGGQQKPGQGGSHQGGGGHQGGGHEGGQGGMNRYSPIVCRSRLISATGQFAPAAPLSAGSPVLCTIRSSPSLTRFLRGRGGL